MNVISKLKIVRNFDATNSMMAESTFNEILSNSMFVEFEQHVIVNSI
jgi:hypothetical protein